MDLNYDIENIHISRIRIGDTIQHTDGTIKTVGKNNIKSSTFMGITLFGDSYRLGTLLVKRLNIKKL